MNRSYRNEILLGLFFFVAVVLLIYLYHSLRGQGGHDEITVAARFDSAQGLVPDNYVMVAGVPVGRVQSIRVEFDKALVEMRLNTDAGLREDAVVRIRPKSLLGEKFIELVPQSKTAPLLHDGSELKRGETPVELDEIFATLRPFFEKLAPMAPTIDDTLHDLDTLLKQLNGVGQAKRETLERILDRTDTLLAQTNALLDKTGPTLSASLTHADQLLVTLNAKAPALLNRADHTLARLDEAAGAIPVDTLKRLPQSYDKLDRALDALVPFAQRLDQNGARLDRILANLDLILGRLSAIDELALRRFLQEEGVNINLTQDAASKERIRQLQHKAP